jgi:glycine oxidase
MERIKSHQHQTRLGGFTTLVVGNGALGLALGFELAKRGQRVAVVGPTRRDYCASTAAGAMNGCFGEITTDLLSSSFGRTKFELDMQATALWDSWADEVAAAADVPVPTLRRKTGTTVILNGIGTQAIDSSNFWLMEKTLKDLRKPYSVLEEHEIGWISPQESSRSFRALHLPDEHSVVTPNYISALETGFTRYGGRLIPGIVRNLDLSHRGAACSATLDDGSLLSADNIVLAAGVSSHALLSEALPEVAARVPPMVSGCGVSVLVRNSRTRQPDCVIRTPNRSFSCGLHAVPRPDGLYIGATNWLSNTPQSLANVNDLHFLLGCAMKQLHTNLSTGQIAAVQMGNRPIPVDGFPLIGALPGTRSWMLTGTYRDGFHQSPLLAGYLARAITEARDVMLPAMFNPVRAPIQTSTRGQIVAQTVNHTLATGFEADWKMPAVLSNRLRADLTRKYTMLANEFHEKFTPPPEILAFCENNPWIRSKLEHYYDSYS